MAPLFKSPHPPRRRPAVESGYIKDLEMACEVLWADQDRFESMEQGLGSLVGPLITRYLTKERMRILEEMNAHGLERRFAVCDSHDAEGLLHPEHGHLRYLFGDVIQVVRRCDASWALGLLRGNVGLFPLEHTRGDNFSLVYASHMATHPTEIFVKRGQVVPTSATAIQGKVEVFSDAEYGLVPRHILSSLTPPPVALRNRNPERYYKYGPLARGHIRLIYITPKNVQQFKDSGKQSIFITLQHEPLNRASTYAAFSYCWGDPTDLAPVFCNGKLLYVPSSLWRLLSRHVPGEDQNVYGQVDVTRPVRAKDPAVFWADAICINQRDTLEKNHQIPLMQTIYQRASQVVAYVGESDSGMAAGISMDMLAQARQSSIRAAAGRPSSEPEDAQDLIGRVDWAAIKAFFAHPLFRRSWVIQEIILSREITFVYGSMLILLSRIHDCALALSENHIHPVNAILGDDTTTTTTPNQPQLQPPYNLPTPNPNSTLNPDHLPSTIRHLLHLSRFKSTYDQGGLPPFLTILHRFRGAEATDPRDKVYALLSLASEEYRRCIVPDYSPGNTAAAVYEHVARCALQLGDLRELLVHAGLNSEDSGGGGGGGGGVGAGVKGLASWAVDWSWEPREAIKGGLFACSGSKVRGEASVSPYAHHDRKRLVIKGSVVDKVVRVGPRWSPGWDRGLGVGMEVLDGDGKAKGVRFARGKAPAAFFLAGRFIKMVKEATEGREGGEYPGGGDLETAVWQTLVCGMMRGESRAVAGDEVHYRAFLECLEDAKSERSVLFGDNPPIGRHGAGTSQQQQQQQRGAGSGQEDDVTDKPDDDELAKRLEKISFDFGLGALQRGPNSGARTGGSAPPNQTAAATAREEAKRRKAALEEPAMPFFQAMIRAHAGRRTCVTERSYLAAVPDQAQEGDEIAIFFGHPVPYVVRRAGGPDKFGVEQFRLVGACYVHGIMDGELVDPEPKGGAAIKGFEAMEFALT